MRASFQFTGDPPVALLSVAGELDLASSDRLRDVLAGLTMSGCTRHALDLEAVTFIDGLRGPPGQTREAERRRPSSEYSTPPMSTVRRAFASAATVTVPSAPARS